MNVTQKPHLHQDWIDSHAIGIVRALQNNNYTTYLVGGCVRDLLLNIHPKDYDIATDARPDQVRRLIHRAFIIGKRFRLVLVRRDHTQFEVATFRRDIREDENREGLPDGDNIFGSPQEDAQRRDFTINGLFYDPINNELIDYAEGRADLEERWIRMIGDPVKRLQEDPIRIMRALRLKHMIDFRLEPSLRAAMQEYAHTLPTTVLPRRREEILKWLRLRAPEAAFLEAHDLGLLRHLSPTLARWFEEHDPSVFLTLLAQSTEQSREDYEPVDHFANLVHAAARAFLQTDPMGPREQLHSDEFQTWMRDELGMFKHEQALVLKALQAEPLLMKREELLRRGERRVRAVVTSEAFVLALRLARLDCALSSEGIFFWESRAEIRRSSSDGDRGGRSGGGVGGRGRGSRGRSRRRRGPRGPRGVGARAGAGAGAGAARSESSSSSAVKTEAP